MRWDGYVAELRDAFRGREFTTTDAVDFIRPHVNPMKAARLGSARWSDRTEDPRRGDAVENGYRTMASKVINNWVRAGHIARVGRGRFRFR